MKKSKSVNQDPTVRELDNIKRLLILLLIKAGASQDELGLALNMDQADVSRLLPARKVKRFDNGK
jgi:hypothetical protein